MNRKVTASLGALALVGCGTSALAFHGELSATQSATSRTAPTLPSHQDSTQAAPPEQSPSRADELEGCQGQEEGFLIMAEQTAKDLGEPLEEVCKSQAAQDRFHVLLESIRDDGSIDFIHSVFVPENPSDSKIWIKNNGGRSFHEEEFSVIEDSDAPTLDARLQRTDRVHDPIHDHPMTAFVATSIDAQTGKLLIRIRQAPETSRAEVAGMVAQKLTQVGEAPAASEIHAALAGPEAWSEVGDQVTELRTPSLTLRVAPWDGEA